MSDPGHNPSFKSFTIRVPGSIHSKTGHVVKIIDHWDGRLVSIAPLLVPYAAHIYQEKPILEKFTASRVSGGIIKWIENLLQTPIDDGKKRVIWNPIAPYLINTRGKSYDDAREIIATWLQNLSACTYW